MLLEQFRPAFKIEIPVADWQETSPGGSLVPEGLKKSPTKDVDEIMKILAARDARIQRLRESLAENRAEKMIVASLRVQEAKARKLRLEASKAAKAQAKVSRSKMLVDSKLKEKEARREERKQKRAQQFAAVRNERLRIETTRRQRHGALAELERRATERRMRKLATTSSKGRAEVAHALEVASALKEEGKKIRSTMNAMWHAKLEAAENRRAAVAHAARETQRAAERRHERRKCEQAAAHEAKRWRLGEPARARCCPQPYLGGVSWRIAALCPNPFLTTFPLSLSFVACALPLSCAHYCNQSL